MEPKWWMNDRPVIASRNPAPRARRKKSASSNWPIRKFSSKVSDRVEHPPPHQEADAVRDPPARHLSHAADEFPRVFLHVVLLRSFPDRGAHDVRALLFREGQQAGEPTRCKDHIVVEDRDPLRPDRADPLVPCGGTPQVHRVANDRHVRTARQFLLRSVGGTVVHDHDLDYALPVAPQPFETPDRVLHLVEHGDHDPCPGGRDGHRRATSRKWRVSLSPYVPVKGAPRSRRSPFPRALRICRKSVRSRRRR